MWAFLSLQDPEFRALSYEFKALSYRRSFEKGSCKRLSVVWKVACVSVVGLSTERVSYRPWYGPLI